MAGIVDRARPAPAHPLDTPFLVACVAVAWAALVGGFLPEYRHNTAPGGPGVPPLIALHAIAYLLWSIVFTVQVALVRTGCVRLHMRLGQAGANILVVMVPLGLAAAISFNRAAQVAGGQEAVRFLAIQIMDMLILASLVGSALWLRRRPDHHRRLMLLAMLNLTAPGFARVLGHLPFPLPDRGTLGLLAYYDGPSDLMIGLAILYDAVTRRRLHPAYRIGGACLLAVQLAGFTILWLPGWPAVARAVLQAAPG